MRKIVFFLMVVIVLLSGQTAFAKNIQTVCNPNVEISNVRLGPSAKIYPVINKISNGTKVEVLSQNTNADGQTYLLIKYDGDKGGFLYHDFVKASCNSSQQSSAKNIQTVCNPNVEISNVRLGPSAKIYPVINKISNGTKVEVLSQNTNADGQTYLLIKYDGDKGGFLYHDFVKASCNSSQQSSVKNYQLSSNRCWLAIGARKTKIEVTEFLSEYSSILTDIEMFKSNNGWFVFTMGQMGRDAALAKMERLVASSSIPDDSYCSTGKSYITKLNLANFAKSETIKITPKPIKTSMSKSLVEQAAKITETKTSSSTDIKPEYYPDLVARIRAENKIRFNTNIGLKSSADALCIDEKNEILWAETAVARRYPYRESFVQGYDINKGNLLLSSKEKFNLPSKCRKTIDNVSRDSFSGYSGIKTKETNFQSGYSGVKIRETGEVVIDFGSISNFAKVWYGDTLTTGVTENRKYAFAQFGNKFNIWDIKDKVLLRTINIPDNLTAIPTSCSCYTLNTERRFDYILYSSYLNDNYSIVDADMQFSILDINTGVLSTLFDKIYFDKMDEFGWNIYWHDADTFRSRNIFMALLSNRETDILAAWNVETGKLLWQHEYDENYRVVDGIEASIKLHSKTSKIAVHLGYETHIIDVVTGETIYTIDTKDLRLESTYLAPPNLVFSEDGRYFIFDTLNGRLEAHDLQLKKRLWEASSRGVGRVDTQTNAGLDFQNNIRHWFDEENELLRVWLKKSNMERWNTRVGSLEKPNLSEDWFTMNFRDINVDYDTKTLAAWVGGSEDSKKFNLETGKLIERTKTSVGLNTLAGFEIETRKKSLHIFNTRDGNLVTEIKAISGYWSDMQGDDPEFISSNRNRFSMSESGGYVVITTSETPLQLIDLQREKTTNLITSPNTKVDLIRFDANEQNLFVVLADGSLSRWNLNSLIKENIVTTSVTEDNNFSPQAVFSSDGLSIVFKIGSHVYLWDTKKNEITNRYASIVKNSFKFSETTFDGKLSLSKGSWHTPGLELLDLTNGKSVFFSELESASFNSDGSLIYGVDDSKRVHVIRTSDGKEMAQMVHFSNDEWITLTPEGFFNASENGAKHLSIVQGLKSISVDQVYDALYRPDLVEAALAGDPDDVVAAAAKKLNLEQILSVFECFEINSCLN